MNAAATVGQRAVLAARMANAGAGRPSAKTEPGGEGSVALAAAAKLQGVGRNIVVKARRLLRLADGNGAAAALAQVEQGSLTVSAALRLALPAVRGDQGGR